MSVEESLSKIVYTRYFLAESIVETFYSRSVYDNSFDCEELIL